MRNASGRVKWQGRRSVPDTERYDSVLTRRRLPRLTRRTNVALMEMRDLRRELKKMLNSIS